MKGEESTQKRISEFTKGKTALQLSSNVIIYTICRYLEREEAKMTHAVTCSA